MELGLYLKYGSQWSTILVAAEQRENAGRFIVRADEKLTAFVELESAIRVIALQDMQRTGWQRHRPQLR